MIPISRLWALLAVLFLFLSVSACKEDETPEGVNPAEGSYFSIRQYAQDQWNTFRGEPFLILKTVRVNKGKYDSSYTNSDTLDWGGILQKFFATEISDPSFLGKYKFTQFNDEQDDSHNYFYEALEDDLYTRKLLISVSQETNVAQGIYIEAIDKAPLEERMVKLYYKPMKRIQIQEIVTPLFGEKTHTVTEYEFER
ncbi:hypothetical protein GCM10023093_31520 [Nemorincola caseinilytica]|uniref:Uncharacterized protein n=1 Tax=Nemorincola caseinilytica TaxID=2054315 RepID=A0ABP8NNT4_9BACT